MTKVKKPSIGSTFESFLSEQGALVDTTNQAIKRVIAYQLDKAMKDNAISKTELAERMATSRSQVSRLLDPENDGVTLHALSSAAEAMGHELILAIREKPKAQSNVFGQPARIEP